MSEQPAFPSPEAARKRLDEQELARAIEAYRFFYPTVSAEGIFHGQRELGIADGEAVLVMAAGPRHVGFTLNSDTPYACAVVDLGEMGPIVVEIPPGAFVGLVDDHHQRWVLDMGLPGPDAGKGGKHLVLPPDYEGDVPAGFFVGRAGTRRVMIALRALPRNGDVPAALAALRTVRVYALSDPGRVLPFQDITERAVDMTPLRWEDNLEFWARLHAVIDDEPVPDEFRPMYGALAALGIRKGEPFAPDERTAALLETAARIGLEQMRAEGFASERPERLVWEDRRWEWVGLVPDDGDFETPDYLDVEARDRWFVQAIVASPAMFRRQEGLGSVYFLAARDRDGAWLDGAKRYRLTVPGPVPAKLFWSVTAYDPRTRSQVKTPQDRAVRGSLQDVLPTNPDGSIDLFFGPDAPRGAEDRWIQTDPETGFFLYFRIYGPDAASLDGTWRLGDLVLV